MTRKDYIELARVLQEGYLSIDDPRVKRGYNYAIQVVIRFAASQNPNFDAIKFGMAVYSIKKH
jgi:hypothetical protein